MRMTKYLATGDASNPGHPRPNGAEYDGGRSAALRAAQAGNLHGPVCDGRQSAAADRARRPRQAGTADIHVELGVMRSKTGQRGGRRPRPVVIVTLTALMAVYASLLVGVAPAQERRSGAEETVPKTFDGAGDAFKEGGKELGEGFRGIGRGIKHTFTGRPAAQEYKRSKAIGTGFKDIGRGVAGGARAVGRGIKRSFTGEGEESD